MAENWTVEGHYMEACTCEAACPCIMLSAPTEGSCTAIVGWQVMSGRYGDVRLDGLNVAAGVYSPGHMKELDWSAALYINERANAQQREALTQIFGGSAGGHPARIAEHIAEVKGVHFVPICIRDGRQTGEPDSGKRRQLELAADRRTRRWDRDRAGAAARDLARLPCSDRSCESRTLPGPWNRVRRIGSSSDGRSLFLQRTVTAAAVGTVVERRSHRWWWERIVLVGGLLLATLLSWQQLEHMRAQAHSAASISLLFMMWSIMTIA